MLFEDGNPDTLNDKKETATLMDKGIRYIIDQKKRNKVTWCDQIPIELIHCLWEDGKQVGGGLIVDLGEII